MPKCATCGVELPREKLFGTEGDFRCPDCARKSRRKYVGSTVQAAQRIAPVTIAMIVLAVALHLMPHEVADKVLPYLSELSKRALADHPAQVWRFYTSTFIHGGWIHLAFNLYWTWLFGNVIEKWMGSLRFVGFTFLLAVGPSAAQYIWDGPAIGLSGVGFGMFGFLFALRRHKPFAAEQMHPQVVQMFIVWFFICLFFLANVGNVAHGAGGLIGWALGWSMLRPQPQPKLLVAGISALVLGLLFVPSLLA